MKQESIISTTPAPKPEELLKPDIHLIVFKLGREEYGIRIEQVKEVTLTPEITRMPKTPKFIKGIANIRGDIIAIMDLEDKFGITPVAPEDGMRSRNYTLVIDVQNFTIGLVVQEVPQSLTLSHAQIDKTPNIIKELNINDKFIDGIGKADGRLIIILDIEKILSHQEIKDLEQVNE
jgi:purine-binding chemotaxis protein CheW